MQHGFRIEDAEYDVGLSRARTGYVLHFRGGVVAVDLRGDTGAAELSISGQRHRVTVASHGDDTFVHLDGEAYQLRHLHPLERFAGHVLGTADEDVRAPMPGSLISLLVAPGQRVSRGQILVVMESMKMETAIHASSDGVVGAVHYAVGQSFDRDAVLVSLSSELDQ